MGQSRVWKGAFRLLIIADENKALGEDMMEERARAVCLKPLHLLIQFLFATLLKSVCERGSLMESALSATSAATKLEKCNKPPLAVGDRLNID